VSFGDDLPVTTFDQMVSYLRYFAAPERLKALRDTAPELRAAAWSAFLRETDPVLGTATHEALRDYFARVHTALQRFHDDSGLPGWLTDRGMVFVTLGDPDQVFDQGATDINQRGRTQVWEYAQYHLQLVFIDQTGFGRWRLTTSSDADFRTVARRVMAH
jgi:GWxTD domain-containing protein